MRKIRARITLRPLLATALSISFVALQQAPLAAAARADDVKSESQVKSEAASYDSAMRVVASVAESKIETPDDLKKVLAALDRVRPNLRLFRSKAIALALADSSFVGGVKKRTPDKQSAEALLKEASANPSEVLKLDGAGDLKSRIEQSAAADATTLRKAAERLKDAAEKIKKSGKTASVPEPSRGFKVVRASYVPSESRDAAEAPTAAVPLQADPLSIAVYIFVAVIIIEAVSFTVAVVSNLSTKAGRDAIAECEKAADAAYLSCHADAEKQPFPLNLAGEAACDELWLLRQATCLTFP